MVAPVYCGCCCKVETLLLLLNEIKSLVLPGCIVVGDSGQPLLRSYCWCWRGTKLTPICVEVSSFILKKDSSTSMLA